MKNVRLIRAVPAPSGRGPGNGQFALQAALARLGPTWLKIGGTLGTDEIPWFWSWQDRATAAMCAASGRPFVAGPNVLFDDSRHPCRNAAEREVCNAASCRLLFTESEWYHELIEQHRGPANRAPIVVWPYPIAPLPEGPLPPLYDVLLYEKSAVSAAAISTLAEAWPNCVRIRYGRYRRQRLYEAARRCRACVYFSDDDRGPLALAEVLLAGCPAVGVPRGAPFIQPGVTGVLLQGFDPDACRAAVAACHRLDRREVAARAARQFDEQHIVRTIVEALDMARH